MAQVIKEFLSPTVRRWIYIGFALIGVGFGATQTAYNTAEVEAPLWLAVAFQVYLYVGGVFGLFAASNTVEPTATISGFNEQEISEIVGDSEYVLVNDDTDEVVEIVDMDEEPEGPKHAAE